MRRFNPSVVAVAAGLSLAACATQNQTVGTVGGAVVGAVIGNAIGGDRGAIIGAALGAAVGNQIGKHLDARDKQRLADARMKALAEDRQQRFYADSAKSNVVVTPTKSFYEPSRRTLALASDLRRVEVVETEPESVIAVVNIPIYRDVNFDTPPKLNIPKGSAITKLAQVQQDPRWVLVGGKDFGLGYVPAFFFDPEVATKLAGATASSGAAPTATTPTRTEGKALPTPGNRVPDASIRSPAPRQAPARTKTDELLAADKVYTPPASHLRQPPVSPENYARALDTGNKAAAIKSVNVQYVKPAVECKELTSILLSNDKETDKEVTKSCRRSGGPWT